jgi:PAS domain S-box-containing protein
MTTNHPSDRPAASRAVTKQAATFGNRGAEIALQTILDQLPAAVYFCDRDGLITYFNAQAEKAWGRAPRLNDPNDRFCGGFKLYTIDGTPFPHDKCWMALALRDNKPYLGYEIVVEQPIGKRLTVLAHANPIHNETGELVGAVNIVVDITERKRAEEAMTRADAALKESEERFRDLFENATDLLHSVTPEGKILYANHAWRTTLGYREDEIAGVSIFDIIHPNHRADCAAKLQRVIAGEQLGKFRTSFVTRDGKEVVVEGSANCRFVDGKAVATRAIFRDITEQIKLEEQLRQAQKMEAIGQLAGGVAHDFNNLLCVISGYSEMIVQQLPEENPHRSLLMEVRKAGERAAALTRQLLAFSRKQVLAPEVLDLNVLVTDTEKMLRRLIGEDIDLVALKAAHLHAVKADPGQIEQILLNLAVNARDAMPRGGKLTIETANVKLDESYAVVRGEVKPGAYVMLAVTDNGCGMDKATQARIFEPFFTTKGPGKGTGLGLATVYGIVKQSGGFIYVYSEPDQGTTFKVYLPRAEKLSPREKYSAKSSLDVHRSATILLVEDDDNVRAVASHSLQACGYTVLEASSGEDALKLLRQASDPVHLVISDVVMSTMNGPELAKRVTQLRPQTKVLFVSGYTDDAVVHHGVLSAEVNFLQKPFSPRGLVRKVREVLEGGIER